MNSAAHTYATDRARQMFYIVFAVVMVLKLFVASRLPPFVDEVFYWQEGQHLALAYSDLPGLTAWLNRIGVALGGNNAISMRLPFLIISAMLPFLVMRITRREIGIKESYIAATFTLLLPLAGTLGIMALPDVLMALATLLCIDAGSKLLRNVDEATVIELALGLSIGALSHYRFAAVIVFGFIALLMIPEGRRALKDMRVIVAIAMGAAAWIPLIWWNVDHADAGLRFQLVDRHPWAFHFDGISFVAIQAAFVTPLLFATFIWLAWRFRKDDSVQKRYFALLGGLVVLGFFVLGFFTDTERVSFHWPLPGYVALLPLLPSALEIMKPWLRKLIWVTSSLGVLALLAYYVAVSIPSVREQAAGSKLYASNFAGWEPLAEKVEAELAQMPPNTKILADNFKIGSELGFALSNPNIEVLDHDLNRRHGRAPQLAIWNLLTTHSKATEEQPYLLVIGATDVQLKHLVDRYHAVCKMVGPLPAPTVVNIDHGAQRFLLFRLTKAPVAGAACTTPVMAWIDTPVSGASVKAGEPLKITGWAIKDGVGLKGMETLLNGRSVGSLTYGSNNLSSKTAWPISNDPNQPNVGFSGELTVPASTAKGTQWLGLRMVGEDGSIEDWSEIPIEVR